MKSGTAMQRCSASSGVARNNGFKAKPDSYTIGLAPTGRATCRVCSCAVGKGEERLVTHAFVKPGRSHDLVTHLRERLSAAYGH